MTLGLGCGYHCGCNGCNGGSYAPLPAPVLLQGMTAPETPVVLPTPVTANEPDHPAEVLQVASAQPTPESPNETQGAFRGFGPHLTERRGFTDITAHPAFAHDRDYRWLVGILDKDQAGPWTLRYASLDENDRFDGHVVLSPDLEHGCPPLASFHPGDMVRVEGSVLGSSGSESMAIFAAEAIVVVPDR